MSINIVSHNSKFPLHQLIILDGDNIATKHVSVTGSTEKRCIHVQCICIHLYKHGLTLIPL